MEQRFIGIPAICVLLCLSSSAFAQSNGASASAATKANKPIVGTLRINRGDIMISGGNAFVSAVPNEPVKSGDRIMISSGSSATVIHNDGCTQTYDKVGVYTIGSGCNQALAVVSPSSKATVGVWAAAVTAAVIYSYSNSGNPPAANPISR